MSVAARSEGAVGHRHIARNTVYNVIGQLSPSLVAVFAVPMLVHGLGVDRFALLTLVWMLIGYFSLFDFGISRALTHAVSDRLGRKAYHDVTEVIETGAFFIVVLGIAGMLTLMALTPWLVGHVLHVPSALLPEAVKACFILAAGIPFVIISTSQRGILEAYQRFGIVNAIRVPMGIYNFLAPVCLLKFTHSLVPIVTAVALGRVVAAFFFLIYANKVSGTSTLRAKLHRGTSRALFGYSSWVTVSNLVGPIMSATDRSVMSALLPIGLVAYYTAPQEITSKTAIVAISMAAVLFPAFARSSDDTKRSGDLFMRGMKMTFVLMFPIALLVIALSPEGLRLWLGADFAAKAAPLMRWQMAAVFFSTFIQVPFAFLQGCGRPDITGKMQLFEMPLYVLLVWFAVARWGGVGAAIAWTVRTAIEMILVSFLSWRLNPVSIRLRPLLWITLWASANFATVGLLASFQLRLLAVLVGLAAHGLLLWKLLFGNSERAFVMSMLKLRTETVEEVVEAGR